MHFLSKSEKDNPLIKGISSNNYDKTPTDTNYCKIKLYQQNIGPPITTSFSQINHLFTKKFKN